MLHYYFFKPTQYYTHITDC